MEHCLAESTFDAPFSEEDEKRTAPIIDAYLSRHGGRWVRSIYARDRMRMLCEFEGVDEETLMAAYQKAEVPFDAVWSGVVYEREPAHT